MNKRKGLTIIEAVVATLILSIGSMALINFIFSLSVQQQKSNQYDRAVKIGQNTVNCVQNAVDDTGITSCINTAKETDTDYQIEETISNACGGELNMQASSYEPTADALLRNEVTQSPTLATVSFAVKWGNPEQSISFSTTNLLNNGAMVDCSHLAERSSMNFYPLVEVAGMSADSLASCG